MYPLGVVLIGCTGDVQRGLLSLLVNERAELQGQYADVTQARDALEAKTDPPFLFLAQVAHRDMLPTLSQLRASFPGHPMAAIVEAGSDPGLLLAAMRSGASQVIPFPFDADDFRSALGCIAGQYASRAAGTPNKLLAISGVTGGCGASFLAVNLADEFSRRPRSTVILAELSLQIGKLATYLDVTPEYSTLDLFAEVDRLDPVLIQRALTKVNDSLFLLSGEYRTLAPFTVAPNDMRRLLEMTRTLAPVTVLDVPCSYDDLYFEILTAADHVVLVGEQKIPSVRTLKLVIEALARTEGIRDLQVVFNRYDDKLPGFGSERLKELLGITTIHTIPRDEATVTGAINNGRPLRVENPGSPVMAALTRLAASVLPVETPQTKETSKSGMFGRLARAFGMKS